MEGGGRGRGMRMKGRWTIEGGGGSRTEGGGRGRGRKMDDRGRRGE